MESQSGLAIYKPNVSNAIGMKNPYESGGLKGFHLLTWNNYYQDLIVRLMLCFAKCYDCDILCDLVMTELK